MSDPYSHTTPKSTLTETLLQGLHFLVFGNFYIAIASTGLAAATLYLQLGLDGLLHQSIYTLLSLIFFGTLFIYNFERVFKISKTYHTHSSLRHLWIERNKTLSFILATIAVFCLLITAFYIQLWEIAYLLLPAGIIATLYSVPIIPTKGKTLRLRDVAFVKIFLIALVWTYVTYIFPLLIINNGNLYGVDARAAIWRLCLVFPLALLFDIRDIATDTKNNVKTLPIILGIGGTKILSYVSIGIYALMAVLQMDKVFILSSIVPLLAMLYLTWKVDAQRSEYFYSVYTDGVFILQALCMVAVGLS